MTSSDKEALCEFLRTIETQALKRTVDIYQEMGAPDNPDADRKLQYAKARIKSAFGCVYLDIRNEKSED